MMVVLITDVEEKSNVPFLLVRAVGHLGRGDTGIGDENRLVVFRRNSRIHHLNPFDTAFYTADGDPISGFERLEDQDQKAGSEIRQIALQGQADSQAKGAERGQEGIRRDTGLIQGRQQDQGHDGIINQLADKGDDRMVVIGMGHHADSQVLENPGHVAADDEDDNGIDDIGTVVEQKIL